ncbi:hypothetical protein SALWKB2_1572 [Snodgrassella alvi wkB2]|nr:hypothetical protein SALWKB2_1572 [Snodgrassella alvi wkB2]
MHTPLYFSNEIKTVLNTGTLNIFLIQLIYYFKWKFDLF